MQSGASRILPGGPFSIAADIQAALAPHESTAAELQASLVPRLAGDVTVKRVGKAASLDLAKCVHDAKFIDFLSTAWERWDAQVFPAPELAILVDSR